MRKSIIAAAVLVTTNLAAAGVGAAVAGADTPPPCQRVIFTAGSVSVHDKVCGSSPNWRDFALKAPPAGMRWQFVLDGARPCPCGPGVIGIRNFSTAFTFEVPDNATPTPGRR